MFWYLSDFQVNYQAEDHTCQLTDLGSIRAPAGRRGRNNSSRVIVRRALTRCAKVAFCARVHLSVHCMQSGRGCQRANAKQLLSAPWKVRPLLPPPGAGCREQLLSATSRRWKHERQSSGSPSSQVYSPQRQLMLGKPRRGPRGWLRERSQLQTLPRLINRLLSDAAFFSVHFDSRVEEMSVCALMSYLQPRRRATFKALAPRLWSMQRRQADKGA